MYIFLLNHTVYTYIVEEWISNRYIYIYSWFWAQFIINNLNIKLKNVLFINQYIYIYNFKMTQQQSCRRVTLASTFRTGIGLEEIKRGRGDIDGDWNKAPVCFYVEIALQHACVFLSFLYISKDDHPGTSPNRGDCTGK